MFYFLLFFCTLLTADEAPESDRRQELVYLTSSSKDNKFIIDKENQLIILYNEIKYTVTNALPLLDLLDGRDNNARIQASDPTRKKVNFKITKDWIGNLVITKIT